MRIEPARVLAPLDTALMTAAQRSAFDHALMDYRQAQVVNADLPASHLNLGRDDAGMEILRQGIGVVPNDAALYHTLGLVLVRQRRPSETLNALGRAAELW